MTAKDPIRSVCQNCFEVIRAPTQRAAGLLLAFHIYDQHRNIFVGMYEELQKSEGDTVLGNIDIDTDKTPKSLFYHCSYCGEDSFTLEQTKARNVYAVNCVDCGKTHEI